MVRYSTRVQLYTVAVHHQDLTSGEVRALSLVDNGAGGGGGERDW